MTEEFKKLYEENKALEEQINLIDNIREKNRLKKQLYTNKIRMIEIIETSNNEVSLETYEDVEKRVKNKPNIPKFKTGIEPIDKNMGGFAEGSFIQLAGSSFAGKTTMVLKILETIASSQKTVFFSYEMYENLLFKKLNHLSYQTKRNILIEQKNTNLDYIERVIRIYANRKVKFFAIDSRMKISTASSLQGYEKNSLISATLSKLTQELGVIILLINQISEQDLRAGRMSLKGSGDAVYDSDVIFYIVYDEKNDIRTLVCKKDRINERLWKEELAPYTQIQQPVIEFNSEIEVPFI